MTQLTAVAADVQTLHDQVTALTSAEGRANAGRPSSWPNG